MKGFKQGVLPCEAPVCPITGWHCTCVGLIALNVTTYGIQPGMFLFLRSDVMLPAKYRVLAQFVPTMLLT